MGSWGQDLIILPSTKNISCVMSQGFNNQSKVYSSFLNPASVFDISFNIYVIASVLGMNEKFVATNQFIFLEQPAQFYFQITVNTTNTSDYNNGYYFSFTSKMDGWMDTKTRVDKQTYRKADRVNPQTIYQ